MTEQFYKKKGRKYVRCSSYDYLHYLRPGFYLVEAYDSGVAMQPVNPSNASVAAAMKISRDAMIKAMMEESVARPHSRKATKRELKAWKAWKDVLGDQASSLVISSAHDIVEAGLKALGFATEPVQ